ncbi:MAG: xanthine dehydrogenase family protein molybdopterin-binding subunit, partial [Chloroflexi bacterium]|nr:xanthine dehydrogenase family protein molybdopterin-binding subunit [Chloroflexota bacterium]
MADYKLIGKNYSTPDLVAKVTGRAKYAEDFRAEGMLFTKLLLSPMPHGRVRNLDTRAAMAMPGVEAILTADDLPEVEAPGEQMLTNEPLYEGEPILAIAAVTEEAAANAIEQVRMDLEPLPFALDPLESLRPGGSNARVDGNTMSGRDMLDIKWANVDWAEVDRGTLPMDGEVTDEWEIGDLEAGFAEADLILDETVFMQSLSHQPLETRTAMAYWQNGKCYMHVSTQSTARTHGPAARWINVSPDDVVLIAEYCGGGFGGKASGSIQSGIPALLSQKAGKPVMMRINRQEENFIGRSRPGNQARIKIGYRADGRVTALDMLIVQDGGPYGKSGDFMSAGDQASLMHQPPHMRMRGLSVYTNTPPRGAQRGPGGVQAVTMIAPMMHKAAKQLGIDQLEMIKINAPSGQAIFGRPRQGKQGNVSSAFVREAVDKGAEAFDWRAMKAKSSQRNGTTVTGVGVALSSYAAGTSGMDGLLTIRPDGRVYIQTGIGNLGTESLFDTARAAMEALQTDWEQAEVVWGDTSKHLPWSCIQGGSMTTHAHTRANWAAGLDAKQKLQAIAARDLGGSPESYDVADGRVFRRGNRSQGMTFARAAERAIALGGRYDGHELPEDLNDMTVSSATALAGRGLMGVAQDNFDTGGRNMSYTIGFAEVEVDLETGGIALKDYKVASDAGTIVNPRTFAAQLHGGGVQGFGVARGQKWIYDRRWGLHVSKRFYSNRPPTILDVPHEREMEWVAAGEPDPFNPLGARGIGEAPQGAGAGAVLCAVADALGDGYFNRTPIMSDMILTKLEGLPAPHSRLAT